MDILSAIQMSRRVPARERVDVSEGLSVRRNSNGQLILRAHYSAHPERRGPSWKMQHRYTYSSQGAWDREQEIVDRAGGGELVFADTLISHWSKIVISDPTWRPDPDWDVKGGFDYGKKNPTVMERGYIDYEGAIYLCGEYYQPGMDIWKHAPNILGMADYGRIQDCYADPSIFPSTNQQSGKEDAKSNNDIYVENGVEIFVKYQGDRSDVSFAERIMQHWANLGPDDSQLEGLTTEEREEALAPYRKPTLRIVCADRNVETPRPGLHDWACPNLLWEMMRMRRVKLTATQLMQRNPAEKIVDKDNHAVDATKYLVMTLPEPTRKSPQKVAREAIKDIPKDDIMSRMHIYNETLGKIQDQQAPVTVGRRAAALHRRR